MQVAGSEYLISNMPILFSKLVFDIPSFERKKNNKLIAAAI